MRKMENNINHFERIRVLCRHCVCIFFSQCFELHVSKLYSWISNYITPQWPLNFVQILLIQSLKIYILRKGIGSGELLWFVAIHFDIILPCSSILSTKKQQHKTAINHFLYWKADQKAHSILFWGRSYIS